jgi:signal transduction histidine kinase/ligand-binding sensor domain-containing protein
VSREVLRSTALLILLGLAAPGYALDPSRTLTQYVHRIWQVQQGLPQASVYAVTQTRDGYLWLGTQTGLVRFDGVRFTTIGQLGEVSLTNVWVTALVEDSQGTLWIGTNHDGLVRLQHGEATRYSTVDGLPSDDIQCLLADRRGGVWVCTPKGLASVNEAVRTFGVRDGLSSADVRATCLEPDGRPIVGLENGQLEEWQDSRFHEHPLRSETTPDIRAMLCTADGAVWVATNEGLFHLVRGSKDPRYKAVDTSDSFQVQERLGQKDGLADDSILTLAENRDGALLVGTSNGFSRVRGREIESFRPEDGLSQSTVYSLYEDRESTLWVATKHGLNQFLDGRAIPYTTSEGLPSNNTGPVLQDRDGTIWVGTLDGGLARFDGRRFASLGTHDGLVSNSIHALAEDAVGNLWVGTDKGLNRLRNGRVSGTWTGRTGLPGDRIRALLVDRRGDLWISTTGGVAVLRDGQVRRPVGFGASGDGVLAFADTRVNGVISAPSSASPMLRHAVALYEDHEGLLWIGTQGYGLTLVDGDRVVTFSVVDGLFDDVIYGIAEDDLGHLWMACSKGIFSANRSDLLQVAAGRRKSFVSTPYSPLDVLRTIECRSGVQPVIARTRDGQLWFSTIRGVLVIDPSHMERRFTAPSVVIEDVTVDGERRAPGDLGELPAGRNNVEFGYTGISFVAPARITFRYYLEGFDREWIDAGQRRQAFYTNLPHGRFRFRVRACNPDGTCAESPGVVAFAIAPAVYQRLWFVPLCLGVLVFAVWGADRIRIRRLHAGFELILTERGRIARELHDTLIQGFAGVTMAMQALASRLPPSNERRALEDMVNDAGNSLRAARRSLAGLRREHSQSGLTAAIEQAARQLTEDRGLRLKLTLDECRRDLPEQVEDNLLRIAQEAVMNAVKHSGARTLHVSLAQTPEWVRLSVKDDGTGFDGGEAPPSGHYGLIGMRERAAQIGAEFHVTSSPGHGTTVSVLVES